MRIVNYLTNPTKIRKIPKSRFMIEITEENNFLINNIHLQGMGLPEDSSVHLYAKAHDNELYYDLGTVGKTNKYPEGTNLDKLSKSHPVTFRLLVVDKNSSYIEASAESVRPNNEEEEPVFPAKTVELGNLIWKVDLKIDEQPVLLLNLKFDHILDLLRNDYEYIGLILPQAVRMALNHLIKNDNDSDPESWQSKWHQFLVKNLKMSYFPDIDVDSAPVIDSWLDEVIEKFSEKNTLFNKAINSRVNKQEANNG